MYYPFCNSGTNNKQRLSPYMITSHSSHVSEGATDSDGGSLFANKNLCMLLKTHKTTSSEVLKWLQQAQESF
jgi:hypothetical protein